MWGEGWPLPLLEMSTTSVYIQSYRNSGWQSPCTKRRHQFVHDILSDIMFLKGEIEVPDLERSHLPQNIAPDPRGNKVAALFLEQDG